MDDPDLLRAIYASATDYAIITMDTKGIVIGWNPGAERILGYRSDEIVGRSGSIIFTREDCEKGAPQQEFDAALQTGRGADDRWHVRKDGSRFWGEGVVTPIRRHGGEHIGFVKILRDNTARKRAESDMLRLANFDALTGVANRNYFQARLAEMMAAMARSEQMLILQVVDFDFFKQVNDSLGHAAGDTLLQQAVARMLRLLRETDFLARMGGDEFVVLQPNAHSPEAGAQLAIKLLDALSHPFALGGREVRIGASIGMAVFPQDAIDADRLLEKADLALYRVKNGGRGGYSYFTERMDTEARTRARNLLELRQAVANREFWLAYQPEVDCISGRIVSLEVLLRCMNPVLSGYPVDKLIDLAAEAGLMPAIGAWVLDEVSLQQREWKKAGLPPLRLSINFCPHELMSRVLSDKIKTMLQEPWMHPNNLEIEITERDIFDTKGHGIAILEELRSLGISIALDDFGSGYSSLSYLRRLPIDRLKLDQVFLKEIPQDSPSCVIARSVIEMAHALDLEVVAEGIEEPKQVEFFQRYQCDAMQGFLLCRPLSAAGTTELLLRRQAIDLQPKALLAKAMPAFMEQGK
jgi:diguanylate cyclase (GGDEF)-like protein/PAS domain S-box-containing protein